MFTALNKETLESVWVECYLQNKDKFQDIGLVDPFFLKPVFVRKSHFRETNKDKVFVRSHFVTKFPNNQPEDLMENVFYDPEYIREKSNGCLSIRESREHLEGKRYLAKYVKEACGVSMNEISFEHRIYIHQKQRYRIADVFVSLPTGYSLALECQLSYITQSEIEERNDDYQSEGIDCIWALGKQARTSDNCIFIEENFGYQPPGFSFGYESYD